MNNVLKDILGNILNPIIPRYEPTILYSDSTGTNSQITLKENSSNFKRFVITGYKDESNHKYFFTREVRNISDYVSISFSVVAPNSSLTVWNTLTLSFSGINCNIIKSLSSWYSGGIGSQSDKVYITEIVGYK